MFLEIQQTIIFSSLSTGLNSMAAVVLEDFWKPFFKELTHRQTQILIRAVVVVLGVICVGKKAALFIPLYDKRDPYPYTRKKN